MSWPYIKVPGPKESGKYYHGRINIIFLSFTDTYPRRLNNFLWRIRDWPVIGWLSILWARSGFWRCCNCRKLITPSMGCLDQGNALAKDKRYKCCNCDSGISPTLSSRF